MVQKSVASHSEEIFYRYTDVFLQRLKQLGAKLVEQDSANEKARNA